MRILNEQRDPSTLRPDVLGAVGVTVGMGALVGAIVQGPDWGWTDPRVLGGLLLAAVLTVLVAGRSLKHPAPIVDPAMVRIRSFSVAVVACTVYYAGFGAMLFGSVLFLTGVWGEDALHAGLMIAPGPTAAALTAVPGSKIAARIGFARGRLLGGIVTASGALWWLATLTAERDFTAGVPPGHGDRRDRGRPHAPDLHGRGHGRAVAHPLLNRRGGGHDGPPARHRPRGGRRGGDRGPPGAPR